MKRTVSAVAVSALALPAGLVSTPVTASASPASASASVSQGMVFVQNDDPAGNQVVAYRRSADGSLHQAGTYPTGGRGGSLNGRSSTASRHKDRSRTTRHIGPCTP